MKIKHLLLLALSAASFTGSTSGQVQSAGPILVNMDATSVASGTLTDIPNTGTLGGFWEARGGATASPLGTNLAGINSIWFDGSNDYLQLVDAVGGALVPPPDGLLGANSTASIEVWAYNPTVGGEETMVSWGKRGAAGANRSFNYGYSGQIGAVSHHGTGASDLGWENIGGAPQNHRWHHLVYTFDGTETRVYADGALVNREAQPIDTAASSGLMLAAQWNAAGTGVGGQYGSLALARVRVHDGALTPAQVLNNYQFEKNTFQPAVPAPQLLASGPAHRYSFSEAPSADANGSAFNDSVGTAHGFVLSAGVVPPQFTGSKLVLPGGPVATGAYGDLPNGLLSVNSTNNGGSGEFSIEVWYKAVNFRPWSHVFDFGSAGSLGYQGIELTGPGGNAGLTMLDDFMYAAQAGNDVNRHRLEWANRDIDPAATTTNGVQSADVYLLGTFNTDRHLVVTWKEQTGQVFAYENGLQTATLTVSNSMSAINDVNNWLGRSQYGDNTLQGEYDEVRIYSRVLSPGEALGDYMAGPDVLNTSAALAISGGPQSTNVLEGSPVGFTVRAGGTPPLFYQWLRNGNAIPGATDRTYSLTSAKPSDHGSTYSVVVSNLSTSATSITATLGVQANQGPSYQFLYELRDGNRDNYSGTAGGSFQIGAEDVPVTHLGYYDINQDGLLSEHRVGIWPAEGGTNLIGFVTVPAGTDALLTNGYRWVALTTPILLRANTTYVLAAEVSASSGDGWPDNYQPLEWNKFFVGSNGFDTRRSHYGGTWPNAPMSANQVNGIYGAPKLATMPLGTALAGIQQTTVTQYSGQTITLKAAIGGQAPVTVQWYKASGTLLAGQTNSALVLSNLVAGDAGGYYVRAANSLGSSQSATVNLVVFSDTPVNFAQHPASTNVLENYPASFAAQASGTPPVSYQWRRNGAAIPGATNSTYVLDPVSLTNHGDTFSCVASNFANGSPQTATSGNAVLTVTPNKAPAPQVLHATWSGNRDNFDGMVGGIFQVGAADALVTHLGFFDLDNDGLVRDHQVGIWSAGGGTNLIASVLVPAGTSGVLTNGYRYIALERPIILTNNTSYILAAESFASSDGWPDSVSTIVWDSYYVGNSPASTRDVRYSGTPWPTAPAYGSSYSWGANGMYGAPNLAALPVGAPTAWVSPTTITQYVGFSASLSGIVNGEAPMVAQWYKSPGVALPGQTNLTLTFASLELTDSGSYYLIASNTVTGAAGQSAPASIQVLASAGPSITADPQSQTVYAHAYATLTAEATGTPPLSYQWTREGNPIPGATNATLVVDDVTSAKTGAYRLVVTNPYGTATSASATLSVISVPSGTYAAAAMQPDLILYYRLNDADTGLNVATNQGSLGFAYDGTYEGGFASVAGPAGFSNFEANNEAVSLDGYTADVMLPSPSGTLAEATMAAWVYKPVDQVSDAAIFFHRSADTFGLSVYPNSETGGDTLRYTWKGTQYAFASGLVLPTNQWAFVAASVTPDAAVLYMYDGTTLTSATNVAAHGECVLDGFSYIGWDAAGGDLGRRWYGNVDEVMLFQRALTAVEIAGLYRGLPVNVTLSITRNANSVTLTWPAGVLMEATSLAGPWSLVNPASSPYTVNIGAPPKFYRVQVQ